jgi:hypothetical protein
MFIITSELVVPIYVVAKVASIKVQLWTFLCNLGDFGCVFKFALCVENFIFGQLNLQLPCWVKAQQGLSICNRGNGIF